MTKKLWGGRFKKKIDKDFFKFQKSIQYDYKLAEYDIFHSKIHVKALLGHGILVKTEAQKLLKTLDTVENEIKEDIKNGRFSIIDSEDIHTEIQNRVEKKIKGELPLKLHTLRSRNDQIVFDEKYYCLKESELIANNIVALLKSLVLFIRNNNGKDQFIGYTHTQRAQAISFSNYISALFCMFEKDAKRIIRFNKNLYIYIGAGALAGSLLSSKNYNEAIKKSFDIDNSKIKLVDNTLDNVSDRDFIIELLSIISIIQMHLSRMTEDFILYSTKEFSYFNLPEEFCTGSSLMPHKKNPDFLELVRGYTGRIYGNLMSILTTMKGLPLTYNRDMQLDKEPLFSSVDTIKDELQIMAKFIEKINLNEEVIEQALKDKSLYATELAEWLVTNKKTNIPFRKAHDIIGRLIKLAESNKYKGSIDAISDKDLMKLHPSLNQIVLKKIMNSKYAISSKRTSSKRSNLKASNWFKDLMEKAGKE